MPGYAVIGVQWGDEGKAKIVDYLAHMVDVVVRFQGGANAGHTVVSDKHEFVFHLVPAGILYPDKKCVIGSGVVVDVVQLCQEIEELAEQGVEAGDNLLLSGNAHAVMPYHKALDVLREKRAGEGLGTTGRGIGPAYADKHAYIGIRICDMTDRATFKKKVEKALEEKNVVFRELDGEPGFEPENVVDELMPYVKRVEKLVGNTEAFISDCLDKGKKVLFEGAQGTMLDIDHGPYPYVTSSNTICGGVLTGSGLGPASIERVVGIVKAYTSRVGGGPLPTELTGDLGDYLRERGYEYGATTGRPRRCGWFDGVAARYASRLNGLTDLAITHLDILDELETVRLCSAYDCDGERLETFPSNADIWARCKPIYLDLPGWKTSTCDIRTYDDLPDNAKRYLDTLADLVGCPISLVGVGPHREQVILTGEFPV